MDLLEGHIRQRKLVGNMLNYMQRIAETLEASNDDLSKEIKIKYDEFYNECNEC